MAEILHLQIQSGKATQEPGTSKKSGKGPKTLSRAIGGIKKP